MKSTTTIRKTTTTKTATKTAPKGVRVYICRTIAWDFGTRNVFPSARTTGDITISRPVAAAMLKDARTAGARRKAYMRPAYRALAKQLAAVTVEGGR